MDLAVGAVQILAMVVWFSLSPLAPHLSKTQLRGRPTMHNPHIYIYTHTYHHISALFCVLRPRLCCWSWALGKIDGTVGATLAETCKEPVPGATPKTS